MNNLDKIFKNSASKKEYVAGYLNYLTEMIKSIDCDEISNFIDLLIEAKERGSNIFFIGNGGSAATSNHFANDIAVGAFKDGKNFKAQSLCSNMAVITAIGNDHGYDNIFLKQLEILLEPKDVVVLISASGNSQNLINAIDFSNQKEAITVGITGFSGGKLKELANHSIHIDSLNGEYGPVEDMHMIIDHVVGSYLKLI